MSWSYSNDPSSTPLDYVRSLIGDTDVNDQLLQNESINFMLSTHSNVYKAAHECCILIMGLFARDPDISIAGALSSKDSQKFDHYKQLASTLYELAKKKSSKGLVLPDSASRDPIFTIGFMDNKEGAVNE